MLVAHRGHPAELVRVAGIRWSVEECFQAAKEQVGLDHQLVGLWTSWHRHITLAMLAPAFSTAVAASRAPNRLDGPRFPAHSPDPMPLTVPEIRHLFAAAFGPPELSAARLLHWSPGKDATGQQPCTATAGDGPPTGLLHGSRNRAEYQRVSRKSSRTRVNASGRSSAE